MNDLIKTINSEIILTDWLRLTFSYGVGSATLLKLIHHFASATAVLNADFNSLAQIVGVGIAKSIQSNDSLKQVEETLAWQAKDSSRRMLLTLNDDLYPPELAEIAHPPLLLFAEGNFELLKQAKIAIVGSRHPTNQGVENCRSFARELAANGLTVVSGMAAGIDRYAHEGALIEKGSTIAVLGTGVDLVYPASNRDIFQQLSQKGLILSEFGLGTNALSRNFPRRNRIIAGLSQACLVIESAIDGGSMITANFALEMGRDILAVPGSIHNPMARGCHRLIKEGAKLVETAADILDELKFNVKNQLLNQGDGLAESDPLLQALGFNILTIDELCLKLNFDFSELCGKLLELEFSGHVSNCGGGRYQRIFHR